MKYLLAVALIFVATAAYSAPFLVCDPQATVTSYKVTGPAWVTSPVAAQTDGSLKMDVSAAGTGNTNLTVAACKTQLPWGEVCSTAVPFSFTRPVAPAVPGGLGLAP